MSRGSYSPPFHLIPNLITVPHWPSDYHELTSFWHFFWCIKEKCAPVVYTSMPILPASSVIFWRRCWFGPSLPVGAGGLDKRRIISEDQQAAQMLSTPLADLKHSDVHRVGNEDHGKSAVIFILCFKCIFLLSLGHPAVALWVCRQLQQRHCGSVAWCWSVNWPNRLVLARPIKKSNPQQQNHRVKS